MRKFLILLLIPFVFACENKEKDAEVQALKDKNDSLNYVISEKDNTVSGYIESLNEIQDNLDAIKEREEIITLNTVGVDAEMRQDKKDKIVNDILLIYELMEKNKRTISRLRRQLRDSDSKIKGLEDMIARLTRQIEEKDISIMKLRGQLANLNIKIDHLATTIDSFILEDKEKTKTIADQTIELNIAFYIVGTEKKLKELNILSKKGGFIGFGSGKTLHQDFDRKHFKKVDIRELKEIPLHAKKKVRIVTNHPSTSYKLKKNEHNQVVKLVITDSKQFWSSSKYLVITVY